MLPTRGLRPLLRASCQASKAHTVARPLSFLAHKTYKTPVNSRRTSLAPSQPARQRLDTSQQRYASTSDSLKHTPLYDMHVEANAKMVDFANFSMPLTYPDQSQTESHKWTRENASLFDVSHMVQHKLSGPLACRFLETVTPSAIRDIEKHSSTLSVLLDSNGGIVDDTVITRLGRDSFYFVTNAGCRETDLPFIEQQMEDFLKSENADADQISWHILDHHSLIALQGPKAAEILQPMIFRDPDDNEIGKSTPNPADSQHLSSPSQTAPANPQHIEPQLPFRYVYNLWSYSQPPRAFDYRAQSSSHIPYTITPQLLTWSPPKTDYDLSTLYFGQSRWLQLSIPSECTKEGTRLSTPSLLISRTGYTGEDGFEISIPPENSPETKSPTSADIAQSIAKAILASESARWAGLAARDSLRLEAGMCLYGHDIDTSVTPGMAALGWVVGKSRRDNPDPPFNGHATILPQLAKPSSMPRRRVGFAISKGGAAREGAEVVASGDDASSEVIGAITSGLPSPSLGGQNIAMGYVKNGYHKKGTKVGIKVRGKVREGEVKGMPFVESRFYRKG